MKKVGSILLCSVLAFTMLVGCGQQGVSTKTASSPSSSATSDGSKATEINFLVMPDIKAIQPTFDLYQSKNPGVKINLEVLPFDKMFEAIEVRLSVGDKGIDAMLVDAPIVANYAVKGYTTELDSYINPESKDLITKSSKEACTYNGKLMALPLNSSCVNLYYNKDIFAEKGITPPENDPEKRWTWEQVVDVAKQLTYSKDGKQIYGLTFEQINRPYQLIPLGQSAGAKKLVSDDGLTTTGFTNSPEMIKGAQFYYDTFNTWKISPKISADQSTEYFTSGQVAMFIGGPWQIPAMTKAKMNFGFAPHPYFKDGTVVTPTGSWCVGVSNYSTKKEEAAKFVEFLTTNTEASQSNFDLGKNLPCNLAVLNKISEDTKYDAFPDNSIKLAVFESLNTAMPRPQLAGYSEWQVVMEKAYSDIMNGSKPDQALNAAVAEIDNQLKKYKK